MIDQQGKLQADIELIDIKSGKSLVKYEGPFEVYFFAGWRSGDCRGGCSAGKRRGDQFLSYEP